jgi:hypothetical protein
MWLYDAEENGGKWAKINRPTAGARFEKELPIGNHPLQLCSLGTPNGQKVTILLEELLEAGVPQLECDAWFDSHWRRRSIQFRFCRNQPEFQNSSLGRPFCENQGRQTTPNL